MDGWQRLVHPPTAEPNWRRLSRHLGKDELFSSHTCADTAAVNNDDKSYPFINILIYNCDVCLSDTEQKQTHYTFE